MRERLEKITIEHIAIFGLLTIAVVAITVVVTSLLHIIEPLSGWIYIGLLVIALLSVVIVYISPNYLESNIPGWGPLQVGQANTPDQSTKPKTSEESLPQLNGFKGYIDVTRTLSADLANQLYQVYDGDYEDPFEATAAFISEGQKARDKNPLEETLEILESDLEAREFILNSENHDMEVVKIEDRQVIAIMDDEHHPPKPGLEFKLYANTTVNVGDTTETFPEWVGTVKVEQVEEPICVMRAISWADKVSGDPAERSVDLMGRGAWVKIGLEEGESIDWDAMEEVYQKLKSLKEEGETNYGN